MANGIVWRDRTMFNRLEELPAKIDRQVGTVMEYYTPRVQSFMRSNAPWKDQTGNARQGLRAEAEHDVGEHSIRVFHSMPYGIWLEVRLEGQYAIIVPTIKRQGVEVMGTLRGLFGKIR